MSKYNGNTGNGKDLPVRDLTDETLESDQASLGTESKPASSSLQNVALEYAERGIPVFPCNEKKKPRTPHSFKDATTDPTKVRNWWAKWPNALIGMPTGKVTGFDVLDLDLKNGKNGLLAVPNWADRSPIIVRTPSGGAHLYFRSTGTLRNSTSAIAPGVDVRAEGGYVILPPSRTSEGPYFFEKGDLQSGGDLPAWPEDLRPQQKKSQSQKANPPGANERDTGDKLDQLCVEMAAAQEGARNDTLNRMAFAAGQLIAEGQCEEESAIAQLTEAAQSTGLPDSEIERTIKSGLTAGKESPRHGMSSELADELSRLASLSPVEYDRQRKTAADRLNIRISTLDKLIEQRRARGEDKIQGTKLELHPPEPWHESVTGEALFDDMVETICRHVALSEQQAVTTVLWTFHAHAREAAEHFPRLHISSPAPRCGKTTLLRTIEPMLPKPLSTENISAAALFRTIEKAQPTLVIDEVDIFIKSNEEMRALLNAGHGRLGSVIRTVGDDFEPRRFNVSGPAVLAGIGRIPSTLEDRSITISLRRRLPDEKIERLRSSQTEHLKILGRRAARWVQDHIIALCNADDPILPDELNDRAQDNWRPLIAIADAISPVLGERARAAALSLEAEDVGDDDNAAIMALGDVAAIFELKGVERLSSVELVGALIDLEDRPWGEWRRGKPISANGLARLLKAFNVRPKKFRTRPKPAPAERGYEAGPIREAAQRYVERDSDLDAEDLTPSM